MSNPFEQFCAKKGLREGNLMTITRIMELTPEGDILTRAEYVNLSGKQSLIAYREQFIRRNWNTWEYPADDPSLMVSAHGLPYFCHEDAVFMAMESER